MKKREKQERGGIGSKLGVIFFMGLCLLTLGLGVRLFSYSQKIKHLEKEQQDALFQNKRVLQEKNTALLAASALSELQGWEKAASRVSSFVNKLLLPEELLLQEFSFYTLPTLTPLLDEQASEGFPLPVRVLQFQSEVSLSLCETELGAAVRSFPVFMEQLNADLSQFVCSERIPSIAQEDDFHLDFSREKSEWILSGNLTPFFLWRSVLDDRL